MTHVCARAALVLALGLGAIAAAQAQSPEPAPRPRSTMRQLMQSIVFINANVVFSAQTVDPASVPRDARSALSTNPLTGLYGGWQAIENSSLALIDAADLLNTPGRVCASGRPVPIQENDWQAAVVALRAAAVTSAEAARARSQDRIFAAADELTEACSRCHRVYRTRDNPCVDLRPPSP
ncbi:MAG: hypothetical protein ABL986_22095 [Vicinamibacterales bacterium]